MSWSIDLIGNASSIAAALEEKSAKMSGDSKAEFDTALPHMVALIEQNWNDRYPAKLRVTANGHGSPIGRNLSINIQTLSAEVV